MGAYVRVLRDVVPWYSGYGANPVHVVATGTVGRVTHTDLVSVKRSRKGNVLARFESDCGPWQAELAPGDFEHVEHSDQCYRTVCHISCPIGD